MGDTKKVYTTGRFGAKYGVGIRKSILKIELKQKQKHLCPNCNSGKLKRIDRGIFLCRKCESQFAGGTFIPQTLTGGLIKKMVSQKSFLPLTKQLIELKEGKFDEPTEIEAQIETAVEKKEDFEHAKKSSKK